MKGMLKMTVLLDFIATKKDLIIIEKENCEKQHLVIFKFVACNKSTTKKTKETNVIYLILFYNKFTRASV